MNEIPHGLLAVAAVLKANGHKIQIVDSHIKKHTPYETFQDIAALDFDILGITGISTSYYFWKEFVPLFRRKYGDSIPIMAGGSVASTMPETFLKFIDVDVIVTSDCEPIVSELTERLLHHKALDDLDGIGYRRDEKVVIKPGLHVKDMDFEVMIPPYDLIDIDYYRNFINPSSTQWDYIRQKDKRKKIFEFVLFSSRGCPYNCFFCSRNFGQHFVQHSVDRFIEHMVIVSRKYSPDLFCIADELMTMHRDWVIDFCAKYKASGLDIPYRINARANSLDRELLRILKDTHCYEIDVGIESGSPTILREMNKQITVEENRKAIRWCNEVGIYASPTMVFGMPSETIETIEETKEFLIGEDVKTIGTFYATAYPGSTLFEYALSKGIIQNVDEYMVRLENASRLVINYSSLSNKTLQKRIEALSRDIKYAWYKKRKMILAMLKLKLQFQKLSDSIKVKINIFLNQKPISLMNRIIRKVKGDQNENNKTKKPF